MVNKKSKTYQARIDDALKSYDKTNEFMGSVSLFQNGESIYDKVIGFSNIESNLKASIDTRYRIGSITKMYTAVLVFKAIEENKLLLDQTIEKYFPKIENASKIASYAKKDADFALFLTNYFKKNIS